MPDHEFEKNIQAKMAELRLPPSAPVWDKVEQHLNKKDKRRRTLLWIPFFLAAAVGIYFLINQPNAIAPQKSDAGKSTTGAKSYAIVEKPVSETIQRNQVHPKDGVVKDPVPVMDTAAGMERPASVKTVSHIPVFRNTRNPGSSGKADNTLGSRVNDDAVISNQQTATRNENVQETAPVETGIELNTSPRVTVREPRPSRVNTNLQNFRLIDTEGEIRRPLYKQTEWKGASRKKRPLEFGVAFSVGRSHINNGEISNLFTNAMALSDISDRFGGNVNSAGPILPPAAIIVPPSRLKAGAGFTAGGYVKKQATRGIQLSLGLNYKLYSTINTLGVSKDTFLTQNNSNVQLESVNVVYATGTTNQYTNYFHFIELPLMAEGRVLKGKLPVFWNAGASYSRLIASNALHYDSFHRLYYKQNKFLQKDQVSLHAALTTKLFLRSASPLTVGPEFTYSVSNLLKRRNDNPKHFTYLGLKTTMRLNN